jgi:DNA-binding NarL/FixJ family response regulator
MTEGGDGGNVISNYTDDEMSAYLEKLRKSKLESNFKHSEESKKIMSEKAEGRVVKNDTIKKISETIKSKIESGEFRPNTIGLKRGQDLGFKHSEESIEKIRKFRKNKNYEDLYGIEKSEAIKSKKSELWIGKKNPNYRDVNRDELLDLLKNGMQTKQIAILYDVTEQTIINKCKKFFNKKPQDIRDGNY